MRAAAYFVASAARMASCSARRLPSVKAGIRLVTTRLLGRAPRGWQPGPVLGWSPCGHQGCQRMVNGQLTDSTRGRRPVIWFSTCCCAPAEHLPASSNPAFHLPPSVRRAVPGDPRDQARRVSTDGSAGPIGIRLLTRNGFDWALRYPLIVEAVNRLKVRSCPIDGEAVACDENGLAVFERLRRKPSGKHVFLYAFDLLELNGQDLRREPLETRKATLREPAAWKPSGAASERTPRPRWRERIPARMQAWP
jgi:hypothetical protein